MESSRAVGIKPRKSRASKQSLKVLTLPRSSRSTITIHAAAKYANEIGGGAIEVKVPASTGTVVYKRQPYPPTKVAGHWDNLPTGEDDEEMIHCGDCGRTTYVYLKSIDKQRELCEQCQVDDYDEVEAADRKMRMKAWRIGHRAARQMRRDMGEKDVSSDSFSKDEDLA